MQGGAGLRLMRLCAAAGGGAQRAPADTQDTRHTPLSRSAALPLGAAETAVIPRVPRHANDTHTTPYDRHNRHDTQETPDTTVQSTQRRCDRQTVGVRWPGLPLRSQPRHPGQPQDRPTQSLREVYLSGTGDRRRYCVCRG